MKVFAISDLHLSVNNPKPMDIFGPVWEGYLDKIFADWKEKVSDEDLVLLCGDFSWAMALEDARADFEMLKDLPGKKIIIRGNHDYWWKSISAVRKILPSGFYAIQNDALKCGNFVICGTRGWSTPEKNCPLSAEDQKIYNREVLRLQLTLAAASKIKLDEDKLICMMHYPPLNFSKEENEMSELFKKFGVDAVVYGHLHGQRKMELKFEKDDISYFLTSCDMVANSLVQIFPSV